MWVPYGTGSIFQSKYFLSDIASVFGPLWKHFATIGTCPDDPGRVCEVACDHARDFSPSEGWIIDRWWKRIFVWVDVLKLFEHPTQSMTKAGISLPPPFFLFLKSFI